MDPARAIPGAAIVFLAVGTAEQADGSADLAYVRQAAVTIAENLGRDTVVVNKSTGPWSQRSSHKRKASTHHISVGIQSGVSPRRFGDQRLHASERGG